MGLDIYLKKMTVSSEGYDKPPFKTKTTIVYETLADFRKINCLMTWCERHVQSIDECGIENCHHYIIEKHELEKLVSDVEKVMKDKTLASSILPTCEGLFYGRYDYDKYYFEDLEVVKNEVKQILETTDFENEDIVFYSWW